MVLRPSLPALLLLLQLRRAAAALPDRLSPRVHVYDLPAALLSTPCVAWPCRDVVPHLLASPYYEPNASLADVFWVPHHGPFTAGGRKPGEWAAAVWAHLRAAHPYLNASIAAGRVDHFIMLECDHGPGDCGYLAGDATVGALPAFWNPADPGRVVGHVMVHGMRDGMEGGFETCRVCFQRGKDVYVPVEKNNACGPLCGYNLSTLAARSLWAHERTALPAPRTHEFFFAGSLDAAAGMTDVNGRAQVFLAHGSRPGWRVVNTRGDPGLGLARAPPVDFAAEMSEAVFCYSPLGGGTGPADRYVAAILFGCIPVMLRSTLMEGWKSYPLSQPFDDLLDWESFAVLVDLLDLPQLHTMLSGIGFAQRRRMQVNMGRVWRKLLFTSLYGSYLGENGHRDAFHMMVQSMGVRAAARPARAEPRPVAVVLRPEEMESGDGGGGADEVEPEEVSENHGRWS